MDKNNLLNVWGKTLLSVYKYLSTVNGAIDNLVLKHGLSRAGLSTGYNTFDTAEKMIALTERKKVLLNLEKLIDDCIARLESQDVRIIVLTYFDLIKSTKCAEMLNISIRTFFRKKKLAMSSFAKTLKYFGYTPEKLFEFLKNENWLIDLYNKNVDSLEKETDEKDVQDNVYEYNLLKCIIKDLNLTGKKQAAWSY